MAVAILGMSLGALYQATGGATRIVALDEKMAYAVELARSLRALYEVVPIEGLSESGKTEGGYSWSVNVEPIDLEEAQALLPGQLQYLDVQVSWPDGDKTREYSLESVAAGRLEALE